MIIDGHTHVWPDKIAARALAGSVPDLERMGDGTVSGLAAAMERGGIDRAVCLAVANTGAQVEAANAFAGGLDPSRFVGFGSVHPDLSPEENVASLERHGLRGVKLHPFFQHYALDDPRLWDTLDALQGRFVVVTHVGAGSDPDANARCTPQMLVDLARRFPRLDVVACHFGGYRLLEEAEELVAGLGVHVDTSWPPSLDQLDPARVRALIERHGPDRVVFSSDWPMADPGREVEAVRSLGLSDDDTEAVLGGNLARLLGDVAARGAREAAG